jgi:hypothetical protein
MPCAARLLAQRSDGKVRRLSLNFSTGIGCPSGTRSAPLSASRIVRTAPSGKKCNDGVADGTRIVVVGGTLRVDPERLRTAAAAQTEVGTFVSDMATGQSITSAGTGMSGLLSEGACQFAGTAFDTAAGAVHEELTAHSAKLSAAADRYHQIDEELGRRLRKFTQ